MADPPDLPASPNLPASPQRAPGQGAPRPGEPIFNVPGIVLAFIVFLSALHFVLLLLPDEARYAIISHFSVVPARYSDVITGAVPPTWEVLVSLAVPLLTYALLHGSPLHLLFNGLWLLTLGTPVARRLSSARFIGFFFLTSILGVLFYAGLNPRSDIPVVGASAGISGLMGGLGRLMFAPKSYDPLRSRLASLLDRRLVTFAVILTLSNVLVAFGAFDLSSSTAPVAWEAHLGGFFAGLLLYSLFDDGRVRNWPPLYRFGRKAGRRG